MPFAGFGYPGNVLAQHIKLKPTVNQRFLRAQISGSRSALFV